MVSYTFILLVSSALERSFAASESGSITVHREMITLKVVEASESGSITVHREMITLKVVEASESGSITVHREMIALKVVETIWGANFENVSYII